MPWHQEPKKDVVSCEKLRGAASESRSANVRMGKPGWSNVQSSIAEYIGYRKGTRGTETSKYPKEEKTKVIFQVAASERERAQTCVLGQGGVDSRES